MIRVFAGLFGLVILTSQLYAQSSDLRDQVLVVRGDERTTYSGERRAPLRWGSLNSAVTFDSLVVHKDGSSIFRETSGHFAKTQYRLWRNLRGTVDSITASTTALPPTAVSAMLDQIEFSRIEASFVLDQLNSYTSLITLFTNASGVSAEPFQFSVRHGEYVQQARGTIRTTFVRDTTVDGTRLLKLRDSITVTVSSTSPVEERTIMGGRIDTRELRGLTTVTRLFDPLTELFVTAHDTTWLTGIETRQLPEGRKLVDSIQFQRFRALAFRDTALHRKLEMQEYAGRFGVGMVSRPAPGAQPIADVRQPRVVDSLFEAYTVARDQTERDAILKTPNLLLRPNMRERFARWHAERRDTVSALRLITLDFDSPLSAWTWNLVRPVLDDPQHAMRLGINSNGWYEAFEYEFRHYPFQTARNSPQWRDMRWCPRSVCEFVAQEFRRAKESRLRTIGLMAQYRLNPAIYADTLIARAKNGETLLGALSEQAQGLNRNSTANPVVPMPSAGAPWREWFVWARGATDSTLKLMSPEPAFASAPTPGLRSPDPAAAARLSPNGDLLRIAELRRGWSLRDTFAIKYAQATVDTARYVYFRLLQSLDETPKVSGDILSIMRSPSVYDRIMSDALVAQLKFVPADSATRYQIERAIVDTWLDSAPAWPPIDSTRVQIVPIYKLGGSLKAHVIADSLHRETVARLTSAGVALHARNWKLPNEDSGQVITLGPILQSGAFARFEYSSYGLVRLPDGTGCGDARGGSCILVLVDGVWYLFSASFWVT